MSRLPRSAVLVALLGAAACEGAAPASSPGKLACAQPVATWCAGQGPACSWSLYADPTRFDCAHTSVGACGPYDVAVAQRVDAGTISYYDASSGELVAAVEYGGAPGPTAERCAAGPSDGFAVPSCPQAAFVSSCPGGRACLPDGAGCMTGADCCSASCAQQGSRLACCPASGCAP